MKKLLLVIALLLSFVGTSVAVSSSYAAKPTPAKKVAEQKKNVNNKNNKKKDTKKKTKPVKSAKKAPAKKPLNIKCVGPDGKVAYAPQKDCDNLWNFWNNHKPSNPSNNGGSSSNNQSSSNNNQSNASANNNSNNNPAPVSQPTIAPTPTPSTNSEPMATPTPTETPVPTATPEPTVSPTQASVPSETPTPTPSETPVPTETPTPTVEPTTAPTLTPTPTPTVAPTATPTVTPTPTMTPAPTPTPTSVPEPRYRISGNVFHDINENGVKDQGEENIKNVNINYTGALAGNVWADNEGVFALANALGGEYTFSMDVPEGYYPITPNPVTVNVSSDTQVNFGIIRIYYIVGTVYYDDNKNFLLDENEVIITDAAITLSDGTNEVQTTPDANGFYWFAASVGNYSVTLTVPGVEFIENSNQVTFSLTQDTLLDFGIQFATP